MFEAYLKDTATDYSKYQKDIDNELRIKVLNVKNINRIVINKQEYQITH
jgi:frataxin-like iron-binding protein CyaY